MKKNRVISSSSLKPTSTPRINGGALDNAPKSVPPKTTPLGNKSEQTNRCILKAQILQLMIMKKNEEEQLRLKENKYTYEIVKKWKEINELANELSRKKTDILKIQLLTEKLETLKEYNKLSPELLKILQNIDDNFSYLTMKIKDEQSNFKILGLVNDSGSLEELFELGKSLKSECENEEHINQVVSQSAQMSSKIKRLKEIDSLISKLKLDYARLEQEKCDLKATEEAIKNNTY